MCCMLHCKWESFQLSDKTTLMRLLNKGSFYFFFCTWHFKCIEGNYRFLRLSSGISCVACYIVSDPRHLGAAKRARTVRAQNKKGAGKKGAEQKGRRAKRAQNKKGARSRCCVTVTFKVVISSDNRVLSQSFFFL